MTVFLQRDILLYAARRTAETHGTIFAVRDDNALESALARARNTAEYDATAGVFGLVASGSLTKEAFSDLIGKEKRAGK